MEQEQITRKVCGDWCDYYLTGNDCGTNPYDCHESREVAERTRVRCEEKNCNHLLLENCFHDILGCPNPSCPAFIGEAMMANVITNRIKIKKYE